MHILSGSYLLTSVPRSVFVMVRGSDDEANDSVVWCNPKNNNGPLAERSAWHRQEAGFVPDDQFDWKEFDKPPDKRAIVRLEHLSEVFGDCRRARAEGRRSRAGNARRDQRALRLQRFLAQWQVCRSPDPQGQHRVISPMNRCHSSKLPKDIG